MVLEACSAGKKDNRWFDSKGTEYPTTKDTYNYNQTR